MVVNNFIAPQSKGILGCQWGYRDDIIYSVQEEGPGVARVASQVPPNTKTPPNPENPNRVNPLKKVKREKNKPKKPKNL
jgi:hypothetical protein